VNNATVSGNTVTLSGDTWPANCAGARFKIGANEGKIASRDSDTQITLQSGHSVSGTNASWTIYYHEFSGGVVKLSEAGSGSAVTESDTGSTGDTEVIVGNGSFDEASAGQFKVTQSGNIVSAIFKLDKIGSPADNYKYVIYASTTPTAAGGLPTGAALAETAAQPASALTGTLTEYEHAFTTPFAPTLNNYYFVGVERTGSQNTSNCVRFEDGTGGSYAHRKGVRRISGSWTSINPQGPYFKIKQSSTANVINQYTPVFPLFAQLAATAAWSDENSMSQTETLNSANVWYMEIRDAATNYGAGTILYVYDGAGGNVRQAVRNNAGTWEYNSHATFGSTTWTTATANTMQQAVIDAIGLQAQNRMTGATRAAVPDSALTAPATNRGTVVVLYSTVNTNNPQVDQTRVNYDSQRAAMDLRSKAYDPGFSPAECYLSARIEYSDADGAGTFYVTRDGGTNWETMPEMAQQGLPLTGNIRLFRGTHVYTTGASGRDVRCRYVTAAGKNQYVRHWGLLAK
jgi:hypothetical protein